MTSNRQKRIKGHTLTKDLLLNLLVARRLLDAVKNGNKNGNWYLERGEIDRALCKSLKLDYKTVSTEAFERLCKIEEMKLTKELKGYSYA